MTRAPNAPRHAQADPAGAIWALLAAAPLAVLCTQGERQPYGSLHSPDAALFRVDLGRYQYVSHLQQVIHWAPPAP